MATVEPTLEEARDFTIAVTAAVIDEQRAAWTPVPHYDHAGAARVSQPHEAFTREHVDMLRRSGATRAQVVDYARRFLNPLELSKLAGDLDGYGVWTGG